MSSAAKVQHGVGAVGCNGCGLLEVGLGLYVNCSWWNKNDFGGIWTHANEDCGLNTAPWTARPRSQLSSESGTRTLVCCVRGSYDNHLHQFGLVENVEIESTTSCMLSTRSANWANPPISKNLICHNRWLSSHAESDQFLTQQTKFWVRGA